MTPKEAKINLQVLIDALNAAIKAINEVEKQQQK